MTHPPVCDYEGSTYQATFWDTGERAYEDGAEGVALRAQLPTSGKLLLEVGAGAGRNTPRYAGFDRVVLLDYSRTQLEQAQQRLGRSDRYVYVVADVYRLPFRPEIFDAATMIRVIHHMADAPAALAQVHAVLAPGATFILEFANKRNFKAIARYWLRRQPWSPFTLEPVEFVALNYDFHPTRMLEWLTQTGFATEDIRALSYFRLGLLKRLLPTGLLVGLDAALQPSGRLAPFSPSVFVRARKNSTDAPAPMISGAVAFRCPNCGGMDLSETEGAVTCTACKACWEVRDGIYDFKQPLAPQSP
ncbi:MAG TPA: class I SAM-dependent methyltransferase [Anaerolineales bacterium]|nr:class I SAM-dependent methyltransferase [Anaerolineales bacterium]